MARIQILELPEGASDERPPFVLVVDECPPQRFVIGMEQAPMGDYWREVAVEIGARGVIVTPETVEIPANEIPVDPDGHPIRLRVEGDFEKFREQVDEEIRYAQGRVTRALGGP